MVHRPIFQEEQKTSMDFPWWHSPFHNRLPILSFTSLKHFFDLKKENIKKKEFVTCLLNTGTEALFGDLGHFSVRSIQISTCAVVYPSIILCYVGQSAVLRKHNEYSSDAFFKSVPGNAYKYPISQLP